MSKNAVTSFAGVEIKTAYQKFTRHLEIHYTLWRSKGEGSGAAGPGPRAPGGTFWGAALC